MHTCIIMSKIRLNQGRLLNRPSFTLAALTICYKITYLNQYFKILNYYIAIIIIVVVVII